MSAPLSADEPDPSTSNIGSSLASTTANDVGVYETVEIMLTAVIPESNGVLTSRIAIPMSVKLLGTSATLGSNVVCPSAASTLQPTATLTEGGESLISYGHCTVPVKNPKSAANNAISLWATVFMLDDPGSTHGTPRSITGEVEFTNGLSGGLRTRSATRTLTVVEPRPVLFVTTTANAGVITDPAAEVDGSDVFKFWITLGDVIGRINANEVVITAVVCFFVSQSMVVDIGIRTCHTMNADYRRTSSHLFFRSL